MSRFQSLLAVTVGLVSLPAAFISAPAYAASLSNGSFETEDFTNWLTIGNTSIQTASFGSNPTEGANQALIITTADGTSATPGELEDFLGLAPFTLDDINGSIFGGSAIQQTFRATAGQTLRFAWNFLSNEASPSAIFNSFAFVNINSVERLADTFSTLIPSSTPFARETGYQYFSYTIPTTGTYSLGIGVATVGDSFGSVGILVDDAAVVPEPDAVAGVFAVGALSFGYMLKRRQWK